MSNTGKIKSLRMTKNFGILKQQRTRDNYCFVNLYKNKQQKGYRVNRLVARAFIPNIKNLPEVNHIDGNKSNNSVENLEWITTRDNIIHSYRIGLRTVENNIKNLKNYTKRGKDNPLSKPIIQYDKKGKMISKYAGIREAGRTTGIYHQNIMRCLNGEGKTAGGFIWKYEEVV